MMANVVYVLVEIEYDKTGSFSRVIDWDTSKSLLEDRKKAKEETAPRIIEYRIEKIIKSKS